MRQQYLKVALVVPVASAANLCVLSTTDNRVNQVNGGHQMSNFCHGLITAIRELTMYFARHGAAFIKTGLGQAVVTAVVNYFFPNRTDHAAA